MNGGSTRDLSELAFHIVSLREYWKRTAPAHPHGEGFRALRNMIEIGLGVDNADEIARSVLNVLDSISPHGVQREIDPQGIEVCFITAVLEDNSDNLPVPSASRFWQSVFPTGTRQWAQ